ncbi:MAG: radical SAM protein [Candidatus Falkowbacteria bacterium]|nr:radical SAM protein [Candidatus Falkowbacteria bacterium]
MWKKFFKSLINGHKNLWLLARHKPLKPRRLWFEVTDNCNSRCNHCSIWAKANCQTPLTLMEMRKISSDPWLSNIESVVNSGGEALLRDDMLDILKLQHEVWPKAHLNLSTNGLLPDRALMITEAALKAGIDLDVGVSLDGMGEKHDKIRGVPGNFKKVDHLLKGLLELRKKYPKTLLVIIGLTLSDLTIDGWEEVKKYADDLGVELMVQWYNQSSYYDNESKDDGRGEELRKKMLVAVAKQVQSTTRERWLRLLNNKSIKFRCFAANSFFVMKCDGSIVPCLTHWDLTIGNARNQSLKEIWQSPTALSARCTVKDCAGCLNSWGLSWSLSDAFWPRLMFFVRHPKEIIKRMTETKPC